MEHPLPFNVDETFLFALTLHGTSPAFGTPFKKRGSINFVIYFSGLNKTSMRASKKGEYEFRYLFFWIKQNPSMRAS